MGEAANTAAQAHTNSEQPMRCARRVEETRRNGTSSKRRGGGGEAEQSRGGEERGTVARKPSVGGVSGADLSEACEGRGVWCGALLRSRTKHK